MKAELSVCLREQRRLDAKLIVGAMKIVRDMQRITLLKFIEVRGDRPELAKFAVKCIAKLDVLAAQDAVYYAMAC